MATIEEDSNGVESERMVTFDDEETTDDNEDTRCGLGSCKPKWLQRFATVQSFVGMGSVSNLLTLSLKMYLISQITTLERRFGFSSSKSGFIISSSQIGFIAVVLFVSHYGRNSHIPKILAAGAFIVGLTGLMFGAAHFMPSSHGGTRLTNETYSNGTESGLANGVCKIATESISPIESTCKEESDESSYSSVVAMVIFVVAMLFQGAASAPRAPLGGTYLDDNNPDPSKSGKYVGIMAGIFTLAPILSFGIGALASRTHHTLQATDLTPRDPRWIGAWWLGFLVLGLVTCLSGIVVLCFPRRLKSARSRPSTDEPAQKDITEKDVPTNNSCDAKLKGPFTGIVRLLKNPVFTPIALCGTFQICALMGTASFITKYMETQFYIPAYKANLMLGAISLLGSSVGPICGGIVTSRFKLTTTGNLHLILVVSILLTVACPIGMLVAGTQTKVVKNDLSGFSSTDVSTNSDQSCASECLCQNDDFRPVCGSDDVTYFSPCHAGCFAHENKTFTDCACNKGSATSGYCAKEDIKVYIMLLYFTLTSFAMTFTMSPSFLIFVRSVSEEDKALAIGLPAFMSTVLGHFPGPIIYGAIVDSSCLLWRQTCSGRGGCDLYDIDIFRMRMFGSNMALFFFAAFCVFVALFIHSRQERKALIARETEAMNKEAKSDSRV